MTIAEEHHDLVDDLAGDDPDYEQPAADPGDVDGVNRALRRYARLQRERDAVVQVHEAELDRIRRRMTSRLEVIDRAIQWEADGLAMYHRARLADDPQAKTLHLPNGTLKARAQQPAWEYDDEQLLAWLTEHRPDLVRIPEPKPAADKAAVKKALVVPSLDVGESAGAVTEDGEVVPGVTVTVRGPSFSVDVDEAA